MGSIPNATGRTPTHFEQVLEDVVMPDGAVHSERRIVLGDRVLATMEDLGAATKAVAQVLAASSQLLHACRLAYFELPRESEASAMVKAAIERAENGRVL